MYCDQSSSQLQPFSGMPTACWYWYWSQGKAVIDGEYVYATICFSQVDGLQLPSDVTALCEMPEGWDWAPDPESDPRVAVVAKQHRFSTNWLHFGCPSCGCGLPTANEGSADRISYKEQPRQQGDAFSPVNEWRRILIRSKIVDLANRMGGPPQNCRGCGGWSPKGRLLSMMGTSMPLSASQRLMDYIRPVTSNHSAKCQKVGTGHPIPRATLESQLWPSSIDSAPIGCISDALLVAVGCRLLTSAAQSQIASVIMSVHGRKVMHSLQQTSGGAS